MIKVIKEGLYKLIETPQQNKVLYLDNKPYIWLYLPRIGHLLETSAHPHKADHVLSMGCYRLYDVKNDRRFSAHKHLELCVNHGHWQGYLLLTGLPNSHKNRSRIIATQELISSGEFVRAATA